MRHVVLPGTPIENRLEELASILDRVDDVALSPKWRLVPWHTRSDGNAAGGTSGARNLETLGARIGTCTLRHLRRDVLGQLPSRTDTRVPIEMTEQQRVAHDELSLPIAVLARKARTRPLTQPELLRLMSLLNQQHGHAHAWRPPDEGDTTVNDPSRWSPLTAPVRSAPSVTSATSASGARSLGTPTG